jgi:hypothetical protein
MSKTTDLIALRSLAEGLSAVATHLEPKEAAEYAATLIQAMSKSTDYSRLALLMKGFSAVATHLEPKEATRGRHHTHQDDYHKPVRLAADAGPVGGGDLTGSDGGRRVAAIINQSMTKNTHTESWIHQAKCLSVVAARLEPRRPPACGPGQHHLHSGLKHGHAQSRRVGSWQAV